MRDEQHLEGDQSRKPPSYPDLGNSWGIEIVQSHGLEVVFHTTTTSRFPEVVAASELQTVYPDYHEEKEVTFPEPPEKTYPLLLPRLFFRAIVGFAIVLCLGLGLGIGLGIGLKNRDFNLSNSAPSSSYTSTSTTITTMASFNSTTTSMSIPTQTILDYSGTCNEGINYCGWYLMQNANYTQANLTSDGSKDPFNDLFLCGKNNALTLNQTCGGMDHCQPPDHIGGNCSFGLGQSCCS
ncbi:hypothetical protein GQ53DRAFT_827944 [Thozetella sp. PMI_491]|nr:hypothetical protein GQ53DRAFT_827944 [Thozetella sp. PMI_491]